MMQWYRAVAPPTVATMACVAVLIATRDAFPNSAVAEVARNAATVVTAVFPGWAGWRVGRARGGGVENAAVAGITVVAAWWLPVLLSILPEALAHPEYASVFTHRLAFDHFGKLFSAFAIVAVVLAWLGRAAALRVSAGARCVQPN